MKQALKILALLMIILLLGAETCDENVVDTRLEEVQIKETFLNLQEGFEVEELSPEYRYAFELSAIQKLNEFADFANIYFNTKLNEEFRIQAKQMINTIFISDSIMIDLDNNFKLYKKNIKPSHIEDTDLILKILIDSITIQERLQRFDNTKYIGLIQFSQKLYYYTRKDTLLCTDTKKDIGMIATKINKDFGNKLDKIWKIYLSEVK